MFARILVIAAAAYVACAYPAANSLMDRVLSDLSSELPSLKLDPAPAYPFKVSIPKNGSHNAIRANFIKGSLVGLSGLVRVGDCTYGRENATMVLWCDVLLNSTQFLMDFDVQGDSGSKKHSISTHTTVNSDAYASITAESGQEYRAQLDRIEVHSVTATTKVIRGKLNLHGQRLTEFYRQVNDNILNQLNNTLEGAYAEALDRELSKHTLL